MVVKYQQNTENKWIIAFCSKIMLGTIKRKDISEKIVCINSSGGMDRTSGHLFNLVIPGPTGSLSIGMFISFSECKTDIKIGLELLKHIWEENFITNFCPKYFMSDDCAAQIGAVTEAFEPSRIFHPFHVLNAMWKWLSSNVISYL